MNREGGKEDERERTHAVVHSDENGVVLRDVSEETRDGARDDVAAAVCRADDLRGDEHEVQQPPREKAAARRELEEAQRRVAQIAPIEPKTASQRTQAQYNFKHHSVAVENASSRRHKAMCGKNETNVKKQGRS